VLKLRRFANSWLLPKSKDKGEAFREVLIRWGVAIILATNTFSLLFSIVVTGDLLTNLFIHVPIYALELFAGLMVQQGRVNLGGQMLVVQIFMSQSLYLLYTRYTQNTMSFFLGPFSLIFAVLVAATLLPPRQILPFTYTIIAVLFAVVFYPVSPVWNVVTGYDPWFFAIWVSFILFFEGLLLSKLMGESERRYIDEQKASQAKSEFLRHVNHELRTPLNSIVPLVQLMLLPQSDSLTEKQQQRLIRIKDGSDYLFNLVATILNFSKIEYGSIDLNIGDVNLNLLVEDALTILTPQMKSDVDLQVELMQEVPLIRADSTLVQEVLINVLSNAIKFTEKGHIRVRSYADKLSMYVEVEDTGTGIEDEKKVFEMFGQTIEGKKKRGSGLGMPIAKRLIELHGGAISFKTVVGSGTTFTVQLPRSFA
jgi:signal transduction histidine kinase